LNQRTLANIEILIVGERTKRVIKLLNETTSENSKCHLHIPQLLKNIYMLKVIVQGILEKRRCERNDLKGTHKTLMPPIGI
jgi:hypothetical protein